MSTGRQQAPATDTGTWGYGLYQSDVDLELLDLVSTEAANMMSDPECLYSSLLPGYFTLSAPIDKGAAVQQLETGVLHRLIRRFNPHTNHGAVVILGVVSMELGVKINPEDLLAMKMALMRWDVNEVKRDQIYRALDGYSNDGTEWKFDGKRTMQPAVISDMAELPKQEVDKKVERGRLEMADEDAITPVNLAPDQNPPKSAIYGQNNAQLTELKPIPKSKSQSINDCARIQEPSYVNRVTFWLPASPSQTDLHKQTRRERKRKPGESLFTLPVKESPKAAMQDMVGHSECLYRLPTPSPPILKGTTKGFTWKDYVRNEHKQKI
ncbi:MAG: hypothetical protein Q9200_007082 [Gallowayella weberi]